MMIHVFYVNKGNMLTYDLGLAMGSVSKLQQAVADDLSIPVDGQVMLVSGGEAMSPDNRVSSYSAGTDTCPIFLFNLRAIEEKNPPEVIHKLDRDSIRHRVEGSINMAPTLATLTTRTQLALELRDLSQEHESLCRTLVHQQHLQHQGWCSVVANMEDSLKVFIEEADVFISWYEQFMERKSERVEMLQGFPESYETLSKMPILPSLRDVLHKTDKTGQAEASAPDTLLAFLTKLEDNDNLVSEAKGLLDELSQLDDELLTRTTEEKTKVLDAAAHDGMKEVRGLENRLSGLEQLIIKAHGLVKEQEEYAQGFVNNQKRCRQLADPNILPDLSISHKQQLRNMEKNDDKLMNHVERCMVTKQELCNNIHSRLRWTMYVEKMMSSLDGRIALQFENLKRLKYRIDKLEQIARAPVVYAQLCAEVCRRKSFAASYRKWSHDVYGKANEWHSREVEYRKTFYQTVGNHFLKTFFPGLDKIPPQVMVTPAIELDDHLPCITEEEITSLKQNLPELESWLMVHDADYESAIVSLVSTLSPDTPSDIVVLSPRTNHSSHGSLSQALAPRFDSQIASQHTAPSTMESISANSNSAGDMVVVSGQAAESAEPIVHLMAKFEPFEDDDISAATDDDFGPASLTENSSAGFMTANFFSMGHDAAPPVNLSDTVARQSREINKLTEENYAYKHKCEELTNLVRLSGRSASDDIEQLKENSRVIQQDVSSCGAELDAFQKQILTIVQSAPALHQQQLEEQLSAQQASHQVELDRLLGEKKNKEREHSELNRTIAKLQQNYDSLVSEMEVQQARQRVEFEAAVKDAEANVTKRLMTEHESDVDEIRGDADDKLNTALSTIAQRDSEIESLQEKVESLQEAMTANTESSNALRAELEQSIVDIKSGHDKQLTSLNETLHQQLTKKLDIALAQQQSELDKTHKLELEELKNTTDQQMKEKEASFQQQLDDLLAEMETAKQEAIAENAAILEANHNEQLEQQAAEFEEKTKQLAESQEQEFQYRAAKMKESLQLANEMKYEERINQTKKETDAQILELKRKLNSARMTASAMSESVVRVEPPSDADSQAMRDQLIEKDDLIKNLQQKLNHHEMTASSREVIHADKVSVKSCTAGDKVILCYDERYRHYVVFSLSAITYFVHSDSLEALGLDPSAPEDQRKTWLLAEVIDKEFCQARKTNNRFNVPVNTKFYRVKAKPWSL